MCVIRCDRRRSTSQVVKSQVDKSFPWKGADFPSPLLLLHLSFPRSFPLSRSFQSARVSLLTMHTQSHSRETRRPSEETAATPTNAAAAVHLKRSQKPPRKRRRKGYKKSPPRLRSRKVGARGEKRGATRITDRERKKKKEKKGRQWGQVGMKYSRTCRESSSLCGGEGDGNSWNFVVSIGAPFSRKYT